jgi:hypothetical protein
MKETEVKANEKKPFRFRLRWIFVFMTIVAAFAPLLRNFPAKPGLVILVLIAGLVFSALFEFPKLLNYLLKK